MEKEAWVEVDNFYKGYKSQVLADLEKRQKELTHTVKGKGKATMEDVAKWALDERDLPPHFQGHAGVGLARSVLGSQAGAKSPLGQRMEDLELMVRDIITMNSFGTKFLCAG